MTNAVNTNKIKAIVSACRIISRMNKARPDVRKSEMLYYQMLSNYFTRLLNARQKW